MSTPMLLMYNLENEKGSKIKLLCLKLRIKIRIVKSEEYLQPLGAVAGLGAPENDSVYQGEGFGDEMLVMVNFTNDVLNSFLQEMRGQQLKPVSLKAVLTPTNASWDSIALHEEIKKEHEVMTAKMAARSGQ